MCSHDRLSLKVLLSAVVLAVELWQSPDESDAETLRALIASASDILESQSQFSVSRTSWLERGRSSTLTDSSLDNSSSWPKVWTFFDSSTRRPSKLLR